MFGFSKRAIADADARLWEGSRRTDGEQGNRARPNSEGVEISRELDLDSAMK